MWSTGRYATAIVLLVSLTTQSPAQLVERKTLKFALPSGETVQLRRLGDAFETPNGYPVLPQGQDFVYARRTQNGKLEPTKLIVGVDDPAAENLIPRAFPASQIVNPVAQASVSRELKPLSSVGVINKLVVRIRFSNHKQRNVPSSEQLYRLFNESGKFPDIAPNGTIKDYINEVSYGRLKIPTTISAWIDLPETEAYYAAGVSGRPGESPLQEGLRNALDTIDQGIQSGKIPVKWSQFDTNKDGYVDAISFIHSGYDGRYRTKTEDGAQSQQRIRSHQTILWPPWESKSGHKIFNYAMNAGLHGVRGGQPIRHALICHEGAHLGGLPDLYDVNYRGSGIGGWGVLGFSSGFDPLGFKPPHLSAWAKYQFGWLEPIILTQPGKYTIRAIEKYNEVYIVNQGFPAGEYLLIANRQPVGFDGSLPTGGLAIWHIDENKRGLNNSPGFPGMPGWPQNNQHYRVALLQADGKYDLERQSHYNGDAGDLFRADFRDELGPSFMGNQYPNTDSYQGNVYATGNRIFEISKSGEVMTFKYEIVKPSGSRNSSPPTLAQATNPEKSNRYSTGTELAPLASAKPFIQTSAMFSLKDVKTVSKNAALLSVELKLDEAMDVHIRANTSATANRDAQVIATGFSTQKEGSSQVWRDSFRLVTLPKQGAQTNFGSMTVRRLPAGKHRIYWKVLLKRGELKFSSGGTLSVQAFPIGE